MKPLHLIVPAAFAFTLGVGWMTRLHSEERSLGKAIEAQQAATRLAAERQKAEREAATSERAALTLQLADLQAQLSAEQKATADASTRKTELEAKAPTVDPNDVVVSFGRVRDMAAEVGDSMRFYQKLAAKNGAMTEEESQRIMASSFKLMSWLPEIAAFEDTPEEIASLQAGILSSAFSLDPPSSAKVEQIIREHFAQMKIAGNTAASQDRPNWREERSAAITQLMWKLRPILPANSDAISFLPHMLNLGAGMDKRVDVKPHANGEIGGSVRLSLPNWPPVPWQHGKPSGKAATVLTQ